MKMKLYIVTNVNGCLRLSLSARLDACVAQKKFAGVMVIVLLFFFY